MSRLKLILLTLLITAGFAQAADFVSGQVIVRFDKPITLALAKQELDPTRFEPIAALVPALNIFLVKLAPQISVDAAIDELKGYAVVRWSQADHFVHERGVPDDPSYPSQWSLHQNSDVDIDAPEAWDIALGGMDQAGNEIVIAVVDGGCRLTHSDLVDNLWLNTGEIAGNSIDDDSNGYVDDVHGWSAYDSSGTIPLHNHGTHVAGICGARGNNGIMIAGANWNVKLMIVAASSTNTSIVAQGYNYVLTQKTLWWESGGTRGANVVVSNSSFGVDFADCSSGSFPIWNDLYNALGEQGTLSTGATANNNVDVDAVGDVPTGCTSPYLIAVTNTNNVDLRSSNAAYGDTAVDLGAPGTNIISTTSDGALGYLSGTSMATPHVAGTLALMHAAASLNFNSYYHLYPDSAALLMKSILLANVDPNASLAGITVTGGRLNMFRAVDAISGYSGGGTVPNLRYSNQLVQDALLGNNNGQVDRGETADLVVALLNAASLATNVQATLSTTDPFVTILDASGSFGVIEEDSVRWNFGDVFTVSTSPSTPLEHVAPMELFITADGGYAVYRTFNLFVGQRVIYWADSVENGEGEWTHANVLPGFGDQWHVSTEIVSSPTHSWKCGNTAVVGNYATFLDAGLVSPLLHITPQSIFSFDYWIDSEVSTFYVDSAYDGGTVEISENGGPFVSIAPMTGYPKTIRWLRGTGSPYTGPFPGVPCYAGATAWIKQNFDLSSFAGDSVRLRFRFGSDSGTQREGWYLDNFALRGEEPPPPLPCQGLYTLSATEYTFTPTYVGNTITTEIVVNNFSDDQVCLSNITSSGGVWSVVPSSMILNSGDTGTLQITFAPTFSHEFSGVIELFSENPLQARDSILVSGKACTPVQEPPPPTLWASGEENFINYTLPWDANDFFIEYAIEYSADGFVSSRFLSLDSITSNVPEWHNAIIWGKEGTGTIGLLSAGTFYGVRLHAKDCIGAVVVGQAAFMNTAEESILDSSLYHLTVMAVTSDSVVLNWLPTAVNQFANILPVSSFQVRTGNTVSTVNQVIGYSDDGSFGFHADGALKKFYQVEPILEGTDDICTPLITWPQNNAWLYGYDEIVLQDFIHGDRWDSFRVEIDSLGFPVLLASNLDYGSGQPISLWVNYDLYTPGLHFVTAHVVDANGITWSNSVQIHIAPHPTATFDAVYDESLNRFNATAINYSGLTGNLVDTWWMCSLVGERLGTNISFEYRPGQDSVSLLLPFPQTDFKLWTGELEWPQTTDPFIGVKVPSTGSPPGTEKMPPESLGVCCVDLQLLTTGRMNSNSADRGPVLECKKEYDTYGTYEVGFRWEIEVTWEVRKGQYNYSFGWDQQSTLIETAVICTTGVGVDTFRVPLQKNGKPIATDTTYHRHNGVNYPYTGIAQGKAKRDPKAVRVNKPDKPEVGKQTKTHRSENSKYVHRKSWPARDNGIWVRGDYQFYARAKDDCTGAECCREWIMDWDVVFCEGCHKIINSAPDVLDLGGGPCHDLAP